MPYLVWLAVVLSCAITSRLVDAQPPSESSGTLKLPAVEVRERPLSEARLIRETSSFATLIETQEATARVDSVADILGESVGVQVRRFGGLGAFSTVSIRGSTPNQVDVYLDGVRLNQADSGSIDLGTIPLDNIERIELYRGFAPLQLGAGSIGGAVQLVTRQIAGQTTNTASVSYGSFETRKVTLYRSQGFDTFGYLVLFNYSESDNDFTFRDDNGTPFNEGDDETVKRQNNDFRSFNVHAKGETTLAGWEMTLSDDVFTKDQGVPGRSSVQSEQARFDTWRNVATLQLERHAFPLAAADVRFQLSHTWQRDAFQDPEGRIGTGVQDEENTSNTFDIHTLLNYSIEPWNHLLGLSVQWRYETFRNVDNLPEQRGEPAQRGPLQRRSSIVLALQDEILLLDERLVIRPLLRYEFVDTDFGAQPTFGSVRLDIDRDMQEHFFSPGLGVKFRLASFVDLKGNAGRFMRVPTLFELFGDRGTTLGNPELDAERSLNWDAGFVLEFPPYGLLNRVYLEYAYFHSNADDLIVFVQTSQATAQAQNIGSAEIRGHEVSWSVTAFDHVRLYGNYTLQEVADTSSTFSRGNDLPGRPRHELHQALEVFADVGKLVYEFDYIARNFLDRANAFVVDDRALHNLRLTLSPFGDTLTFTFEVKNITDNQVADFRGFPLPGRSFFGTVQGRF